MLIKMYFPRYFVTVFWNSGDCRTRVIFKFWFPKICKAIFSSPWRYIFSLKIGKMKDLRKISTSVFQVRILKLGKFIHIFELSKAEKLLETVSTKCFIDAWPTELQKEQRSHLSLPFSLTALPFFPLPGLCFLCIKK